MDPNQQCKVLVSARYCVKQSLSLSRITCPGFLLSSLRTVADRGGNFASDKLIKYSNKLCVTNPIKGKEVLADNKARTESMIGKGMKSMISLRNL